MKCERCFNEYDECGPYELDDLAVCRNCYSHAVDMDAHRREDSND